MYLGQGGLLSQEARLEGSRGIDGVLSSECRMWWCHGALSKPWQRYLSFSLLDDRRRLPGRWRHCGRGCSREPPPGFVATPFFLFLVYIILTLFIISVPLIFINNLTLTSRFFLFVIIIFLFAIITKPEARVSRYIYTALSTDATTGWDFWFKNFLLKFFLFLFYVNVISP